MITSEVLLLHNEEETFQAEMANDHPIRIVRSGRLFTFRERVSSYSGTINR
jgi:hypothetical protein